MRTIKVEARGERWPLHVSVGLAAWRSDVSAQTLMAQTRAAVRSVNGEDRSPRPDSATPPTPDATQPASVCTSSGLPPALGGAGRS